MHLTRILSISVVAVAAFAVGCGGGAEVKNTNSANTANTNVAKANSGTLTTTTPTPTAATNDAPTLKPVFKAYCAAYVKKDEAAVRNAYSKETIAFFQKDMKPKETLIEFLADDGITNETCDARNEIITGDSATVEITTKAYPQGFRVVFEKEGGEWKLTNKNPAGSLMK